MFTLPFTRYSECAPVSNGQLSSCHGDCLHAAGAHLVHGGAGGGGGQPGTQSSLHNILVIPELASYKQFCGSGIFIPDPGSEFFPSRIPDPSFFHHGSTSKSSSILTQKIVTKLSEMASGLFIPVPDSDFLPIPDP